MRINKKIKSMQSFHKDVNHAVKGDRVAICVTQFDSKQIERGIVCTPNTLRETSCCIIKPNLIKYYKSAVKTKSKYHITIGNETVMGYCTFFSCKHEESKTEVEYDHFNSSVNY